jgi:hypothetical protein
MMLLGEILSAADAFFSLPDDVKRAVPRLSGGGFTRGYIPVFGESGRPHLRELKEAFSYGWVGGTYKLDGINILATPHRYDQHRSFMPDSHDSRHLIRQLSLAGVGPPGQPYAGPQPLAGLAGERPRRGLEEHPAHLLRARGEAPTPGTPPTL